MGVNQGAFGSRDKRKRSTSMKGTEENRAMIAEETFRNAGDSIGPISPGMHKFLITRGQFGLIDSILHVLDQIGPSHLSLWSWAVSSYEQKVLARLMADHRILSARLIVDVSIVKRAQKGVIAEWAKIFGSDSIRYVISHAKMARIWNDGARVLVRGSFNLNFSPRFEQVDISEGCAGFDLVERIEGELPNLPADKPREIYAQCQVGSRYEDSLHAKRYGWADTMQTDGMTVLDTAELGRLS